MCACTRCPVPVPLRLVFMQKYVMLIYLKIYGQGSSSKKSLLASRLHSFLQWHSLLILELWEVQSGVSSKEAAKHLKI